MRTIFIGSFLALALVACGSSSDDGNGSSSNGSSSSGSSSGASSSGGSSSSSGTTSSSSSSSSSGTSGSSTKALGEDCTAGSECADGKCLTFTDKNGQKRGFCTRQCTKAADCPEKGWVCNLAPHTACVPDSG